MKNIVFYTGALILILTSQCKKKEIVLKDGIGMSVNGKNAEIKEVIFTKEENGLRLYLISDNKLIKIFTNNRDIGSYKTSYMIKPKDDENYSRVLVYDNDLVNSASSGSFEITKKSGDRYSGSFNYNVNLISSVIEIKCIFEQMEATDVIPIIEGTYTGLANEPYNNENLSFHDYNSEVIIQTNNDTTDFTITSGDSSFQDCIYNNVSANYVMSQEMDTHTNNIIINRRIVILGEYEDNPLVVASVSLENPMILSILGTYFFRKE